MKVQSMALLFGLLRNLRAVFALPPAPDQVLLAPVLHAVAAVDKTDHLRTSAPMQSSLCSADSQRCAQ